MLKFYMYVLYASIFVKTATRKILTLSECVAMTSWRLSLALLYWSPLLHSRNRSLTNDMFRTNHCPERYHSCGRARKKGGSEWAPLVVTAWVCVNFHKKSHTSRCKRIGMGQTVPIRIVIVPNGLDEMQCNSLECLQSNTMNAQY